MEPSSRGEIKVVKNPFVFLLFSLMVLVSCDTRDTRNSQGEGFLSEVNQLNTLTYDSLAELDFFKQPRQTIPEVFKPLSTGSVMPKGWILNMMKQDLNHGIVGALDDLYPGFAADDLYDSDRRGAVEDVPEMGDLVLTGEEWETSIMWWNSETIGNWRDGFIRHAFMTQDEEAIQQSHSIVNALLASQDEDGYIGIYKPQLRYKHKGSNGELWSQTTAFRMLLAYFEFTKEPKILEAVQRAVAVTMNSYNYTARNPYNLKNEFGGVTHGLMFTDICETLYRITGEQRYQDYAIYLYQAFSQYDLNRAFNDLRYSFLLDRNSPFTAHGVHTYEHLRSLSHAYHATGYDELANAYDNAIYKLNKCLLPSGAGHGMEWIAGLDADPSHTASEYCTMLELRNFFGTAAQRNGDMLFADKAELLTYNGMLGARNENGTALSYGKPDNCYKMDGKSLDSKEDEVRYKYSPVHSEPAVCCVPNYTRNLTYLMDQMWAKSDDSLALMIYGPNMLTLQIENTNVIIEQNTNYPYSDEVELVINVDNPVEFTLLFRHPSWTKSIDIEDKSKLISSANGFYSIKKTWKGRDTIHLTFNHDVLIKETGKGEAYIQRGPIVYAYNIPHIEQVIKDYDLKGFHDYYCLPTNEEYKDLTLVKGPWAFKNTSATLGPKLYGKMFDEKVKQMKSIELIPMGKTVLRRISFPSKK